LFIVDNKKQSEEWQEKFFLLWAQYERLLKPAKKPHKHAFQPTPVGLSNPAK
jgi:hypothetical protein